jgi:hypothetical protein
MAGVILNLEPIRRAHSKLLSKTSAAIVLELADAGKFAVDYVKAHPTFTPRSGELQAKTRWVPYRGRSIRIQNTAPHAHAQDGGSGLHGPKRAKYMIAARRSKALRFMWKGRLTFRRYVMHPGVRPTRFLYRATTAAGRILHQGLDNRMQRIAREFTSSR